MRDRADCLTLLKGLEKYLNEDPEILQRISPGFSPRLDEKELIELIIDKLPLCTISLRQRKFKVQEKKAANPLLSISMSFQLFRRMALSEDRVVWSLMDKETKVVAAKQLTHPELVTLYEILVALQEVAEKKVA